MKLLSAFENHKQWPHVKEVAEKLINNGFKAFLAGGCVRDAIIGRVPKDFDIATDAPPTAVEGFFEKTIPVGREFGIVIVPFSGFQVEVATFRKDGAYVDGRHPEAVTFSSPQEDAARRDFTVNALFYDIQSNAVIDHVGGLQDIKDKSLRAVGDPCRRFDEDKLRLMRAVRFSGELNFSLAPATYLALCERAESIQAVSVERIFSEMNRIWLSENPVKGFNGLFETGLLQVLMPELFLNKDQSDAVSCGQKFKVMLNGFMQRKVNAIESYWAGLFLSFNVSDAKAHDCLMEWHGPRQLADDVTWLVQHYHSLIAIFTKHPAKALRLLGHGMGVYLLDLLQFKSIIERGDTSSLESLVIAYNQICDSQGLLPAAWVKGKDVLNLGLAPGKSVGELVEAAYDRQLLGESLNRKELLEWLMSEVSRRGLS
ncbi:MAG: CCA tRNA nucleotidyltransferase [Pseudobdellovibrionaceae bacterium]|nr:CCA tRNA nucleotidyltransferase [Bdellovibrionales bacterium]USN48124.1 MAG: CCA tRNA nucleotidyltransferase [Pseudobdellovibrionaceae bacterium]